MLERLRQIIGEKRKLAFYPGGGYTAYVLELLSEAFPADKFELTVFDTNPAMWGTVLSGHLVQNPEKLTECGAEIVIVSNYNYAAEIYQALTDLTYLCYRRKASALL